MKNQDKVEAIRRKIVAEREGKRGKVVKFSEPLKREVLALLALPEWGRMRLGIALGLAPSVLHHWVKASTGTAARPRLRKVRVVEQRTALPESRGLVLVFACGAKLEGLTLPQVAELLAVGS